MSLLDVFYDRFLLSTKKRIYRTPGIKDRSVGNTPLIRLFDFSDKLDSLVYAKLESENPTRSAKDRVADYIISKAIRNGQINKNSTIIEASSGNTGLALARIAKIHGLKCIITTKDKVSPNKIQDLRNLDAEVHVCDSKAPKGDLKNYVTLAEHLTATIDDAFYVNQNFNEDNALAHYHSTGPEIWNQTGGRITHLFAAVSTGGTLSGTARYLKEMNPDIQVIAVDAKGSVLSPNYRQETFSMNELPSYNMDGVGKKFVPGNVHFDLFDEMIQIDDVDAYKTCVDLLDNENLFLGHSSGAVMQAIILKAAELPKDACSVGIFADHGSKYTSSIYNESWLKAKGFIQ